MWEVTSSLGLEAPQQVLDALKQIVLGKEELTTAILLLISSSTIFGSARLKPVQ